MLHSLLSDASPDELDAALADLSPAAVARLRAAVVRNNREMFKAVSTMVISTAISVEVSEWAKAQMKTVKDAAPPPTPVGAGRTRARARCEAAALESHLESLPSEILVRIGLRCETRDIGRLAIASKLWLRTPDGSSSPTPLAKEMLKLRAIAAYKRCMKADNVDRETRKVGLQRTLQEYQANPHGSVLAGLARMALFYEEHASGLKSHEPVNVIVVTSDGSEMFFRMSMSTRIHKLFSAFCTRRGIASDGLRWLFDGHIIDGDQTPQDLGMEDGDMIDLLFPGEFDEGDGDGDDDHDHDEDEQDEDEDEDEDEEEEEEEEDDDDEDDEDAEA